MAETVNPINPMKTVVCNTIRDLFKVDSGHSLYLVLSHPTPGPTGNYDASRYSDIETWKHGIVAKRILDLNVHLMAAKNEWKYETVYVKYTDSMSSIGDAIDTTNPSVSNGHYVTTPNGNVYICIDNNNGALSTVTPTGAGVNDIKTSDGYVWKYIMTVTDDLFDYTTDELIPIRSLEVDTQNANRFSDARSLQYEVQYNAVDGAIHHISRSTTPTDQGFSATTTNGTVRIGSGPDATTVKVSDDAINTNNPTGYEVRFTSGNAIGIGRGITAYDNTNGTKSLTVESAFGVTLDAEDTLDVLPLISVYGDGTGADAVSIMGGDAGTDVVGVSMIQRGSGYQYAYATIDTSVVGGGTKPLLDVEISPNGGHGSDPLMAIRPSKIMISGIIERDLTIVPADIAQKPLLFPVENGYSQWSLLMDPIIGGTGPFGGKIAGSDVDRYSLMTVSTVDSASVSSLNYDVGDFVMGTESHAGGVVTDFREFSSTVAYVDLKSVSGSFKSSEIVVAMTGDFAGNGALSSTNKGKSIFQFQEDRYLGTNTNNYSLMTTLGVVMGGTNTISPSQVSLDDIIHGASGSTGILVFSDTTSAGTTANLYVTGITGSTWGEDHGYTIGETVTVGGGVTASINTLDPPGLVSGSGTILHSEYTEMITRHPEQTEMLRVVLDF